MTVLIRGAQVLAGSPAALSRADVLIDGDRVAAVGPALAAPADARVLDATGRRVDALAQDIMAGRIVVPEAADGCP